jgi:AcrR family transcriptional regulator
MVRTPNATRRGARRQQAFLDAATAVFLAKGYGAATLDDVMRASGGSRATLYKQFGGRRGCSRRSSRS